MGQRGNFMHPRSALGNGDDHDEDDDDSCGDDDGSRSSSSEDGDDEDDSGSAGSDRAAPARRTSATGARAAAGEAQSSATELGMDDDIVTDVLMDNALGFQTHKTAKHHARIPVDLARLEAVMLQLGCDHNIDRAFTEIFGPDGLVGRDFPNSHRLDAPAFHNVAKWSVAP